MSHFFQNRPPNHPKNLTDLFWPHKDLEIPLTKTFLGSKTPWNPPVIPSLTFWYPSRSLTKPKTNQQGSKSPITPTKTPISPYHLKSYSPGLLSTLQDPWKPPVILFWLPGIPIEQADPPRSLITPKTTQQPTKSPMTLTKTPIPLY